MSVGYSKAVSEAFWRWFAKEESPIRLAYANSDFQWLDSVVTPRVKDIGNSLNWEFGAYHATDDTFVLSPTIRENLPLTKAVVADAPPVDGWRFLHAKPRKLLSSLSFTIDECSINADDWRYRLTSYNEGEFVDIDIFVNEQNSSSTAYDTKFFELVVEALVGEERRLDRIGYLNQVFVQGEAAIEKATLMKHLNAHLDQVLAPETLKA